MPLERNAHDTSYTIDLPLHILHLILRPLAALPFPVEHNTTGGVTRDGRRDTHTSESGAPKFNQS